MSGQLAGAMRERVTIERRDATRDALGGLSGGWAEIGSAWAGVVPARPGLSVQGGALAALPHWLVTLRAGTVGVKLGDHVVWKGRRLQVRLVGEDPRRPDRLVLGTEEQR